MPLNVTLGSDTPGTSSSAKPAKKIRINLDVRKSLDGDIMIFDHGDIDIVLSPAKNKITCFPKELMSDIVYASSSRLFGYLMKRGIVVPESVQGGSIYDSLEGDLLPSTDLEPIQTTLLNISKWIDEERPYFEFVEEFDELNTDRFTDPEEEDSTELGEVPHEDMKGTLRPGYNYGPYWQNYTL